MDLDEMIKYLIWAAFFILAFVGLYFALKKLGVV